MTIKEMSQRKETLERAISKLVLEFVNETGCSVTEIDLNIYLAKGADGITEDIAVITRTKVEVL